MTHDDDPEVITVHLRRRSPEEQVEYVLLQVALLTAKVNQLGRENRALILAVKSLENRLAHVERATPWKAPKSKPPVSRYKW